MNFKMKKLTFSVLLMTLSLSVVAQNTKVKIDRDHLIESVTVLADDQMCGREPGSGYDLKAATYIEQKLSQMGYSPLFGRSGIVEFCYKSRKDPEKEIKTYNVVMTLKSEKEGQNLLLGAHYDHLGVAKSDRASSGIKKGDVYNGANDNASGVASMLEIADNATHYKQRIKHNLIFVAFGAEEEMLNGSTSLNKMLKDSLIKVDFMVNLEMTGAMDSSNVVMVLGEDTFDMEHYFNRVEKSSVIQLERHNALKAGSDHLNFVLDCPVAVFATTGNTYYHHPKDDVEWINFQGMEMLTQFVSDFFYMIATDDTLPVATGDIRKTFDERYYQSFPHLKR